MASLNGALSPPLRADSTDISTTSAGKRKRDDNNDFANHANGPNSSSNKEKPSENSQRTIRDLLDILKIYDLPSSILTRPLSDRASSTEPQAKRHKTDDPFKTSSITARSTSGYYLSLDDVLKDIDKATSDYIEKLQLTTRASVPHALVRESKLCSEAEAFNTKAQELVRGEQRRIKQAAKKTDKMQSETYNGDLGLASGSVTHINASSSKEGVVLTLHGEAQGPKQLYTSFQVSKKNSGFSKISPQALKEIPLPNGISVTKPAPVHGAGTPDKKSFITLGDLFPTPAILPQFQPPVPSKTASTNDKEIGWYHSDNFDFSLHDQANADSASARDQSGVDSGARPKVHASREISTGHWLDYGSMLLPTVDKKNSRESLDAPTSSKPATSEVEELARLFQNAYSTFAPTKDDSAAIVPTGTVNQLWWQKTGRRAFNRFVEDWEIANGEAPAQEKQPEIVEEMSEEEKFKEMIDNWDRDAVDPSLLVLEGEVKSIEEKDTDEVLQGISDLLETLNSYQYNRFASLKPQQPLSTTSTGPLSSPAIPSEAEQATYEILKSQLILLIASLPPYAIARLDSNHLSDLGISTKLAIRPHSYKGVMEEDEAAVQAKATAVLNTQSSISRTPQQVNHHHTPNHHQQSASQHRNTPAALYGNQYASSRTSAPTTTSYYGSQTGSRPIVNNLQRPAQGAVPYDVNSTPYRPQPYNNRVAAPYTASSPYASQASQPNQQVYNPNPSQPYPHASSTPNYMRQSQGFASPQPVSATPRYPNQSFPQQNPLSNGTDFRYGPNRLGQGSPQKTPYGSLPMDQQPQRSSPYATAVQTPIAQPHRPYDQGLSGQGGLSNGAAPATPQQTQAQRSITPYSTFMTHSEQSSMMERQRAQLAQQQVAQQQARSAAHAGTMGSPSKVQVNGNNDAMNSSSKAQINGGNPVVAGL